MLDHSDKDGSGQLNSKEFHLGVNGIELMLSEQEATDYTFAAPALHDSRPRHSA